MSTNIYQLTLYTQSGERKYLNQKERIAFRDIVETKDDEIKLFCLLIYWTGVRISEAKNLCVANVDFDDGKVVIKSLKKRSKIVHRQIPIPTSLISELQSYITNHKLSSNIWKKSVRSYSRYVKEIMNEAKIFGPQASAKGLRHSFAILSISREIPITIVQDWLGHSSILITQVYLTFVYADAREFAKRIWEDP